MPVGILEITGAADFTAVTADLLATDGVLEAVTVFPKSTDVAPGTSYAEIALFQGGTDRSQRIAVLATGYVTNMDAVAWTGRIGLTSNMRIGVRLWTNTGLQFKLVAKTILERPLANKQEKINA